MQGYIANFIVYTMAMVGFICLALFVYKKSMSFPQNLANKDYFKVENLIKLAPTKTVYIIKVGFFKHIKTNIGSMVQSTIIPEKKDRHSAVFFAPCCSNFSLSRCSIRPCRGGSSTLPAILFSKSHCRRQSSIIPLREIRKLYQFRQEGH